MSAEPGQRVLRFLRAEHALRLRDLRPDRALLAQTLEAQGLPPHEAFFAFEEQLGGWDGSGIVLGVVATARRSRARLSGHALIGRRGRDEFFLAPDGAVITIEDDEPVMVAGSAATWLEQLALRHAVEARHNAVYLRVQGMRAAELAQALGAERDLAASDRVGCWALPRGQGLLAGPYGGEASTLALAASVRAAARILSQGVRAASVTPVRPRDELLRREDAPPRASVLARATPIGRGSFERAVELSQQGQDPVIEQWSLAAEGQVRVHEHLRDGDLRRRFFLGLGPCPELPGARELACDPLLRCGSDQELEALLFARGFASFPAALAFDRRLGGVSFWANGPALLGIAALLRCEAWLTASEVGGGVPIARAEGRWWRLTPAGVVEAVEEDDGSPQRSFPTVEAFLGFLARQARPFRGFAYAVRG